MMSKILIYNFGGYPGDLYQLIPQRYLASFLASLNRAFPDSCQLWDRGNLKIAEALSLKGIQAGLLQGLGRKIFQGIREKKTVSHSSTIPFKLLIDRADRYLKKQSKRIIQEDAGEILKQKIDIVFLNFSQGPGLEPTLYLIEILKKEKPQIKIIGIGHRICWLREYSIFLSSKIDACLMGTHSNSSLVALSQGQPYLKIPNLIFKNNKGESSYTGLCDEDLDCLPLPDYSKNYKGIEGKIPLYEVSLTNEACPFQCNFCVRPIHHGTKSVVSDCF